MRPVGVEPVQLAAMAPRAALPPSEALRYTHAYFTLRQAFDEHLVPPCAAPVQGELAAAASTAWVNSSALNWLP
jgi:hypothetical protein